MKAHILFTTGLFLLLSACSENAFDEYQSDEYSDINQIIVTANDYISEDMLQSRTAFDMSNLSNITFQWSEKDTIGIFPSTGDQVGFPMANGAGSNKANFNGGGWALKSSSTYYAYYPFDRKNFNSPKMLDKIPFSFVGQKAAYEDVNKVVQLGEYDFMYAKASTPTNGSVNFSFEHLGAICRMVITFPETSTYTNLTITANEKIFPIEGTFDLTASSVVLNPKTTVSSISIDLENLSVTKGDSKIIYFMLPPVDCKTLSSLELALIDNTNQKYAAQIEKKTMLAGKAYGWTVSDFSISQETGSLINGVAKLTTAGLLSTVLKEEMLELTSLKIIGRINGTDVKCLRQMLGGIEFTSKKGKLISLDLSETTIIEGGESYSDGYGSTYTTVNNEIGLSMFSNTQLGEISIPNSVTTIAGAAFSNTPLVSVIIPDNVIKIGMYAFSSCYSLTNVTIGNGITTVSECAFQNCSSLSNVNISNSVKTIDRFAFSGCSSLVNLSLPSSVMVINEGAFNDCSLINITIPENVVSINIHAFDMPSLENIIVDNNNSYFSSLDGILYNKEMTTLLRCPMHKINVSLPNDLKQIGYQAFETCTNLSQISIPNSVVSIGDCAFRRSAISDIIIPDKISVIPSQLFDSCTSLETIIIGSVVTKIYDSAFNECVKLSSIYSKATSAPILETNTVFEDLNANAKLYIPMGSQDSYEHEKWLIWFSNVETWSPN